MVKTAKGVSPVIIFMVMTATITSIAVGTVVFLQNEQDTIREQAQQPQLDTVELQCQPNLIEWEIRNTGNYAVTDKTANLFVRHNGTPVEAMYRSDIPADGGFQEPGGQDTLTRTMTPSMELGHPYTFELQYSNVELTAQCVAGAPWWDVNWDYRRSVGTGGSQIMLDTAQLIRDGKMRPDCKDIRAVSNGNVVDYSFSNADCNTDSTPIGVNSAGQTYIYYGNLQADDQRTSTSAGGTLTSTGPEESIH